MIALYQLGVRLYGLVLRIAALWNPKASEWVKGRSGLLERLEQLELNKKATVWMHCPSLGEFEQGRPIIEALRKRFPEHQFVVTFFSPSGYRAQKNYDGADHVLYLPLDTKKNARRFVQALQPEWAIFVKYDFWLNYLRELKSAGSKVILASGIFRPNQHFFGGFSGVGRMMLRQFDHFFVQNQQSVELLKGIGFNNVTKSGDTRFDRVAELADRAEPISSVANFCGSSFTIVAGSTWPVDEKLLAPMINDPGLKVKWIIAPHEISENHIVQLERQIEGGSVRLSDAAEGNLQAARVMIIDNIGLLSRIYQYAQLAYIGGGFGKSIHNILEAAAWGAPTLFGPRHKKFAEALALIDRGGALAVSSGVELRQALEHWYNDSTALEKARVVARTYVSESAGATAKITNWIAQQRP